MRPNMDFGIICVFPFKATRKGKLKNHTLSTVILFTFRPGKATRSTVCPETRRLPQAAAVCARAGGLLGPGLQRYIAHWGGGGGWRQAHRLWRSARMALENGFCTSGVIILTVSRGYQSQKMGLFPLNPSLRG